MSGASNAPWIELRLYAKLLEAILPLPHLQRWSGSSEVSVCSPSLAHSGDTWKETRGRCCDASELGGICLGLKYPDTRE